MDSRSEFLEDCLAGWTDAQRENPEWLNTTKAEKKAMAKEALEWFDKMHFSLSMIERMAQEGSAMLDDKPEPKPLTEAEIKDREKLERLNAK